MFWNIGKVLIASLGIVQAARIAKQTRSDQQDFEEDGGGPPAVVQSGLEESEIRQCALRNLEFFETMVGLCPDGSSASDSMAVALERYGNHDLIVSRQDSLSLAAMSTSDIFVNKSFCAEGQTYHACALELPSKLWLRQFWRFQDLAEIKDLAPEDETKSRIFNAALDNHGISHSRLHSQCASEINNPEVELMRECVLHSVPAFVHSQPHSDVARSIQSPLGDQMDLSNNENFQRTLRSWLRGMWQNDDEIISLYRAAGLRFRFGCRGATHHLEAERAAYRSSIIATQFPLTQSGVTQECHDASPSALDSSRTLERLTGEIGACAGEGANCTEQEHPCPEGFKCDCQRAQRAGQELAVSSVLGGVAGALIGSGVQGLIAGAAGLAFAPEMAVTWAYGAFLFPGKTKYAIAGAAVSSYEFEKSCMCFPVECTYNKESDQCEMIPSETSTESRNPFATVPFNGLKCVEQKSHHWFHHEKQCDLAQCSPVDTSEIGPIMGNKQLFGRVGRSAHWGDGVYNCANTDGTTNTLLSRLQKIPSAEESVENTVEGRIEILTHYS